MPLILDLSQGNAAAFPFPQQFQWTKDGTVTRNTSRTTFGYPSLGIGPVSRDDHGNYTLTASNSRLEDTQSVIGTGKAYLSLNVLYGPEIEEGDTNFVAVVNSNVTIFCGVKVTGNPAPVIKWTNNKVDIAPDNTRYIVNSGSDVVSLMISKAELFDSGNWTCTLSNSETDKEVQRNVTLTIIGPPSEPLNVTVQNTGSTWTVVLWAFPAHPGTPTFSNFIVTAIPMSTGEEDVILAVTGRDTSVNLTGLSPGLQYRVTVAATTTLDSVSASSNSSMEVFITTNTTVPDVLCDKMPTSLSGIITVEWTYAHLGGLNLSSVSVDFASPSDTDFQSLDNGEKFPQNKSQTTTLQVPGFVAGIMYTFRVTATNGIGSDFALCPAVLPSTGIPQTPVIIRGISSSFQQVTLTVKTIVSGVSPSNPSFMFVVLVNQVNTTSLAFEMSMNYPGYQDNMEVDIPVIWKQFVEGETYNFQVRALNIFGTTPLSALFSLHVPRQQSTGQPFPVEAVAGGGTVGILIICLVFGTVIILLILRKRSGRDGSKFERSSSLEMVTNENYGTTKSFTDENTRVADPPQYEAIPITIHPNVRSGGDQLSTTARRSENPLYSSAGELRLSGVFNTYDVLPGQSREHSRSPSLTHSTRSTSVNNSPRLTRAVINGSPPPQLMYSSPSPVHHRPTSYPTYSMPTATREALSPPLLPEETVLYTEPVYAQVDCVRSPSGLSWNSHPIVQMVNDPGYTEL